jgi:acetolactate synthase-1/3 small subunit
MSVHELAVVAQPGRDVPSRVAALLLPLDVEITSLAFIQTQCPDGWFITLTVDAAATNGVELLRKRLHRLISVRTVVETKQSARC